MQTSFVFNQVAYPGAGDVDDCWAVASLQCVHAVQPQRHLVGIPVFREQAGNPDDPNEPDGGTLAQIVRGVTGCYPVFDGKLRRFRGASWTELVAVLNEKRPVSLAVVAGKLPLRLQYGFAGRHQVALALDGTRKFANPLAKAQSRWDELASWDVVKAAALEFGRVRAGTPGIWAVVFPTYDEMQAPDTSPFTQADIDAAELATADKVRDAVVAAANAAASEYGA